MPNTSKTQDVTASDRQTGSETAAWAGTRTAGETVNRGAHAAQQSGRIGPDAMRRGADATVDMTRQSAQAGVDVIRHASKTANETVRRTTQAVTEGQRQMAQDAAQKFEAVSHKVAHAAQDTSENMRRLMTLPNAAEGGLRDMRQGMAGLIEGMVQTNLRAT